MRQNHLKVLAIGQAYSRSLDGEGAEVFWYPDGLELTLTFDHPTLEEKRAIETGIFEIGLNVVDQIPFLCFRIFQVEDFWESRGSRKATLVLPWQECPFHLTQVKADKLPALDEVRQLDDFQLSIAVVLTDLSNGSIHTFRHLTLSPFFSKSYVQSLLQTFPYYTSCSYPKAVEKVFAKLSTNSIGDGSRIRCQAD
jgi:hypothetical protein